MKKTVVQLLNEWGMNEDDRGSKEKSPKEKAAYKRGYDDGYRDGEEAADYACMEREEFE